MVDKRKHFLTPTATIVEAYKQLNEVGSDLTLFILDKNEKLIGTLTDGDIRRGIIQGKRLSCHVRELMNENFSCLTNKLDVRKVREYNKKGIKLIPLIDNEGKILKIYNIDKLKSILPVDAVIMAGGEGKRLRPLTETTPKPMIQLGSKPMIEYAIDRLILFGIENIYISVNYLKEQIIDYFGDGTHKGVNIHYIEEDKPLGTVGALSLVNHFDKDILFTNSDLFTNIDYEDFYLQFKERSADMAIASIPYTVNIPYAILEEEKGSITNFIEKPSNTHYANAGIYLIKKELVKQIPYNKFYNTTDLMQKSIEENKKIIHNPLIGYWIDIGKHEDLRRAQEIVKHTSSGG